MHITKNISYSEIERGQSFKFKTFSILDFISRILKTLYSLKYKVPREVHRMFLGLLLTDHSELTKAEYGGDPTVYLFSQDNGFVDKMTDTWSYSIIELIYPFFSHQFISSDITALTSYLYQRDN